MPVLTRLQMALGAAAVLAVCLLVFFVFVKPGWDRRAAAEARGYAIIAEGRANAARDAGGVIVNQSEKEIDRAELDARNEAAIRSGEPGAALRALCLRDATRNEPACVKLRNADPR